MTAQAQNPLQPRLATFDREQQVPAVPDDIDDQFSQPAEPPQKRSGEFVIAPLPSRSPLLGWTLAVPAMYLYRPAQVSDTNSAWITGAMGLYTEDGGWGAGLFHKMSFGEDRWRLAAAAFYADINYDFFGIGGEPDTSIPLNQTIGLVMLQALRQIRPNVYLGLRFVESESEVRLDIDEDLLPPGTGLPEIGTDIDLTTLAPRLQYDSRDSEFYPTDGVFAEAAVTLGREWLGGDRNYEKYDLEFNDYRAVTAQGVLATRVAMQYLSGDAPFFIFPAFGSGADLRGYDTGAYRDRFLFAAQTEYRYRLRERFGITVFGGIGTTAPEFADWTKSLWSVGAGIRWVVAPNNDFSLRIDVARGRDETQFYVGLGEAF